MQLGRTKTAVIQFAVKNEIKGKRWSTFQKGCIPWNKGKTFSKRATPSQYPSPASNKIGEISTRTKRGRTIQYIKYSQGIPPAPLHRYLHEQLLGPIPAGHVVVFLDGNTLNTNPDNLQAMSRSEHSLHIWSKKGKRERERFIRRSKQRRRESLIQKEVRKLFND